MSNPRSRGACELSVEGRGFHPFRMRPCLMTPRTTTGTVKHWHEMTGVSTSDIWGKRVSGLHDSGASLLLTATAGYKRIGTTNALNGDEDDEIKNEAAVFWKEVDMRTAVNAAVADAKQRCVAGKIPWRYAAIRKEIKPYPHKNCLHVLHPGHEDEATQDIEEKKWEVEEAEGEQGGGSDAGDQVEDFCPEDWVDGADAEAVDMKKAEKDAQDHGNGSDAQHHGNGATVSTEVETMDDDAIGEVGRLGSAPPGVTSRQP